MGVAEDSSISNPAGADRAVAAPTGRIIDGCGATQEHEYSFNTNLNSDDMLIPISKSHNYYSSLAEDEEDNDKTIITINK